MRVRYNRATSPRRPFMGLAGCPALSALFIGQDGPLDAVRLTLPSVAEMARVAVFIDWQNAYQQARAAFGLGGAGHEGQFSPFKMGMMLAARNKRGESGQLLRVEIHRGQPLSSVDPIGHAAVALQAQAWKAEAPAVVVTRLRPLAKQADGRYIEKGVDVNLAACAIEWSLVHRMDTVIVVSHDSDLRPAIEVLARNRSSAAVETASWRSSSYFKRIAPYQKVVNHALGLATLQAIADPTKYGRKPSNRSPAAMRLACGHLHAGPKLSRHGIPAQRQLQPLGHGALTCRKRPHVMRTYVRYGSVHPDTCPKIVNTVGKNQARSYRVLHEPTAAPPHPRIAAGPAREKRR